METVRFGAYLAKSARKILDKGDLRDYWIGISSVRDFLGTAPSYTLIKDMILRLCHRLITCSIARGVRHLRREEAGSDDIWRELPVIDMGELVRLQICEEIDDT
ncbi:hypothetical protein Tco_1481632 [Tanacetum coccineum]